MDWLSVHMDNSTARRVAQAVTAAMDSAGATQVAISEATGIPRTTLLRRLAGHSPFTVAELDAVANYLGVGVADLIPRGEVA